MTRLTGRTSLIALLLVMGLMVPAQAGTPSDAAAGDDRPVGDAQPVGDQRLPILPLIPAPGELVSGPVEVAVRLDRQLGDDGPFVRQVSFFDVFFDPRADQERREFVGFDDIGVGIGESPRCDIRPGACVKDGIWNFTWTPFFDAPTGPHTLDVEVFVCPQPDTPFVDCEVINLDGLFDVIVDLTPPDLEFLQPPPGAEIEIGTPTNLTVEPVPGGDAVLIEWTIQSLDFLFGKGLPLKDQHVDGAALSTDGDSSCAPTAAGSSISWFGMTNDAYSDLIPEGDTEAARMRALVTRIGELSNTDDDGTSVEDLVAGIRAYLAENGLADAFEVELDDDPSLDDIAAEHGRGQDVLVGIYGEGFAHRVAIERVIRNADGTSTVEIMDPWSGAIETLPVDADGQVTYHPPWSDDEDLVNITLDRMIHVSPTPDGNEAAVPDAGGRGAFAGAVPGQSITMDTSGMAPGEYLLRATATDAAGVQSTNQQFLTLTDIPGTERLSGPGREQTAVAISADGHPDGTAPAAVLARADAFPDALAGTPLAAEVGGPLLLTGSDRLGQHASTELRRALMDGATVYLLGGEAALSAQVLADVEALGFTAVRYGGASRTETAAIIATDGLGAPTTVLLTTGDNFPDALGAGVAAAEAGGAVLLTAGDTVPPATQAYLDGLTDVTLVAIGGPAAAAAGPDVEAIVGSGRFETAVMVAERFFDAPTAVGLATGGSFPDALGGGAHIAALGGPMLLSSGDSLPQAVADYLAANAASVATAELYGGPGALANDVARAAGAAVTADATSADDVTTTPTG